MSTLQIHLLAESSCVETFLSLLDQEEQAMTNGLFADLASITEQKTGLLGRMAELDQQRESAQIAMGFGPGRTGADAAASAGGEACQQIWMSLLTLAEKARDSNRRNGTMVFTHLDFTQNAINFLQAGAQPFYGPDGVRKTTNGLRTRLALG